MGTKKYVLIDGHSLAYRAYYALPSDLATSSGQVTNAVYGFISMLIKVLEELRPQAVLVAFDKGKPAFRTDAYAEYKAHRKPMPDQLREQMDLIHAVLEALQIPCLEREGFEADDVLATLAEAMPEDVDIYIVTGDRDAFQLVNERVRVVINRKGISDIVTYDEVKVKEKFGVGPDQIVDFLALKGDYSDNIPGIPGIGEKTAAALIGQYGSLEGIYSNLDSIQNARLKRALTDNRESAFLSRDLAKMRKDVPLEDIYEGEWEIRPWREEAVQDIFNSLEFKRLYEKLESLKPTLFEVSLESGAEKDGSGLVPPSLSPLEGRADLEDLLLSCEASGKVSFFARIDGEGFTRGRMRSLSIASGGKVYFLDFHDEKVKSFLDQLIKWLKENDNVQVSCFKGKDIMVQCFKMLDAFPSFDLDVELAMYLINPTGVRNPLQEAVKRYLGISVEEGPSGQLDLLEAEKEETFRDAGMALAVEKLVPHMKAELKRRELQSLYEEVEKPLQAVLADMETRGVRIDTGALKSMEERLQEELNELEENIYQSAGERFNLNSPQQLSRILYEVLKLPPLKRTKLGYTTDVGALTALKGKHPIAESLLRYREISKLLNTYICPLQRLVDPVTGRLHTCYNQTVTATGRLSSSNPNLQNIPIRTPLGKNIRKAFLPTSEDGLILSADYSQIELRILAHLSGDEGLRKAFREGVDIHLATASEVFGVSLEDVSPEHRRKAKAINFGIIYGISPSGLASQLEISYEEAETYIRNYFDKYPRVRMFLDELVHEAVTRGFVATLFGRRREIPELSEKNMRLRRLGERLAYNTPIQGSAADIIKVAMTRIHQRLREEGLESKMILQVHDELVFDVEKGEENEVRDLVVREMENACELDVPLKVEVGMGRNWLDAK
jgi:DNA polymerase-1